LIFRPLRVQVVCANEFSTARAGSELHLAMGPSGVQGERFSRRRLLQDQFVVVHRKRHPAEFSTEKVRIVSGAPEKHVPSVPGLWRLDFPEGCRGRGFISAAGNS
jgi:hypothetical protein